jgi:hypothetical protein
MARCFCSYGRSVVTSDLSRPAAVTVTRHSPISSASISQGPPSTSVISHRPPSRAFHRPGHNFPQANTLAESHSTLYHQKCSPPPHFASRTVSGSMDDSMALWNLRALAGRHLPFADTDRRRTQARCSMVCNLWRVPVASWSSTKLHNPTGPLGQRGPLLSKTPGSVLIPEPACCFIPALPCSPRFLRCWPPSRAGNARKKSPIFVLILLDGYVGSFRLRASR